MIARMFGISDRRGEDDHSSRDGMLIAVSPFAFLPPTDAPTKRIYHLFRALDGRGFRLVIVTRRSKRPSLDPDPGKHGFNNVLAVIETKDSRYCQLLNVEGVLKTLRSIGGGRVGGVFASMLWAAPAAWLLSRLTGSAFIFDDHNFEYGRFSYASSPIRHAVRALEGFACRNADLITVTTEEDRAELIRHYGVNDGNVEVVRNGTDVEPGGGRHSRELSRQGFGLRKDEVVFGFCGTFDYHPNVEAFQAMREVIAPSLREEDVAFLVAGKGSKRLGREDGEHSPRIVLVGYVSRIEGFYASCDCFLCPTVSGGGSRIKIIEAASFGLPVIATEKAMEGFPAELRHEGIMVAGDWEGIIGLARRFSGDEEFRRRKTEAARREAARVYEQCSWHRIGQGFSEMVYNRLRGEGSRSASPLTGASPGSKGEVNR